MATPTPEFHACSRCYREHSGYAGTHHEGLIYRPVSENRNTVGVCFFCKQSAIVPHKYQALPRYPGTVRDNLHVPVYC